MRRRERPARRLHPERKASPTVSIVVIGVNHRTGPIDVLERVAVSVESGPKALTGLISRPYVRETVLLSTCNRTEVYVVAERFHGAYADIRDFFCELGGLTPDELHPHLYSQHDHGAITHLFEVAAGLDSAVLGEHEILGQVRGAWQLAQREGGSKSTLNLLFRHAVETGKRVRTDTAIGRGTASVSHAAVEMATEHLGSLHAKRVLVVGAGEMGEGVAVALASAGAASITVINRTEERAMQLAERVGGGVAHFSALSDAIAVADVVVTCTGSGTLVLDHDAVAAARHTAANPLLIVDIAVPRDVDASVGTLDGVTVLNLDDLRDWAARGVEQRWAEAEAVRGIVAEEVERFQIELTSRQAAPLVAQLHQRADSIRQSELDRFAPRLASLDAGQREAVEAVTRGIVAKLLHAPSVRLKGDSGTPSGERNAAAVRDLFDLT
ncbi:MAG TPA: glutamyl-tRNA reductase [Ilumatobacteraceae bacterium]|nr:glutamyl-tRNA reductase [Ilumatobacteraceae bacterium]